jgi:hypothetical protein
MGALVGSASTLLRDHCSLPAWAREAVYHLGFLLGSPKTVFTVFRNCLLPEYCYSKSLFVMQCNDLQWD